MNYIVVGLGNPGAEYEKTRHNIGRRLVEGLSSDWKSDKKVAGQSAKVEFGGKKATLVLPDTFMNKSGASVRVLAPAKKADAEKFIVCHDDIDLPVGKIKISFNRGSAGHKGVESIRKVLGTDGFVRLRIGIAQVTPSGKIKKGQQAGEVVLKNFSTSEEKVLQKTLKQGREAIEEIVTAGHERAMNKFN